MSISSGPYKSTIPVVNVEEVQLSLAQQDLEFATGIMRTGSAVSPDTLDITVQMSNEIVFKPPPQVKIGNWIHFTFDEEEALELTRKRGQTKNRIRSMATSNSLTVKLVLDAAEFSVTDTQVEFLKNETVSTLPIRCNKIRRTLRIPTGDLKNANLYMVVASFSEHRNYIKIGNISHHTILEQGRVPATAALYKLAESVPRYGEVGSIWPGPVHHHDQRLMAGARHSNLAKQPYVTAAVVPNIKVKDMRILAAVQNTSPSYVPPNRIRPFISPLEISRTASGTAQGMFSFDLAAYIAVNSSLSGIMLNDASLLNSVAIKDIIIYQRPSGKSPAGNSLTPTGIPYCGLNAVKGFEPVARLRNGCEILNTLDNGNSILNVSFKDNTVVDRGVGYAEYKVEILLGDRANEVVASGVAQLTNLINQATTRLTLRRERGPAQLYARTIETYLNLIEYLFGMGVFGSYTKEYWRNNMLAMMYGPQVGDQEKMQLMTAIEAFIQQLNNLIQKVSIATATTANYNSKMGQSSKQNVLTYHHKFTNKLYLQGVSNVGLGYVDDNIQDLDGVIPQISRPDYRSRTYQEIDKYNVANSNATGVNQYGYLSPSFIGLGRTRRVSTAALAISNDPALPLLQSNLNTNVALDVEPRQQAPAQRLNILRAAGVGIAPLKVPLKKEVIAPDVVNPPPVAASDYLSSNSSFYQANREANEISGSQRSIIRSAAREALTASPLVATMVNQTMINFAPPRPMVNTEPLNGALAVVKNNEDPEVVVNSTALAATTNFGALTAVQYLEAYDLELGVKQQFWRPLNATVFAAAEESGRPLICRLRKITNTINTNPAIELDPMAAYFVVGSITARATLEPRDPKLDPPSSFGESYVNMLTTLGPQILYSSDGAMAEHGEVENKYDAPGLDPGMASEDPTGGGY
jgi:hypothetical protein